MRFDKFSVSWRDVLAILTRAGGFFLRAAVGVGALQGAASRKDTPMNQGYQGYIKLYRQIEDTALWSCEPFSRSQAWIDMLIMACHKPHAVRIRGILIKLTRGQLALSEYEYAKRWQWSRGKVRRFLTELQNELQIVLQKNNVTTVVSITNYDRYQGNGTANGTTERTANGLQTDTYKKGRREEGEEIDPLKPPKRRTRKSFQKPTPEEVDAYSATRPIRINGNQFWNYYEARGWKFKTGQPMKDWKATVRTWEGNEKERGKATSQPRLPSINASEGETT